MMLSGGERKDLGKGGCDRREEFSSGRLNRNTGKGDSGGDRREGEAISKLAVGPFVPSKGEGDWRKEGSLGGEGNYLEQGRKKSKPFVRSKWRTGEIVNRKGARYTRVKFWRFRGGEH